MRYTPLETRYNMVALTAYNIPPHGGLRSHKVVLFALQSSKTPQGQQDWQIFLGNYEIIYDILRWSGWMYLLSVADMLDVRVNCLLISHGRMQQR